MYDILRHLSEAVDAKDPYTTGHMDRVARYAVEILHELPFRGKCAMVEDLRAAALLHDIGKVRVPSRVLMKEGKLDVSERMEMELHPLHGRVMLGRGKLARRIAPWITAHHEMLDGKGYPEGLVGKNIPLPVRIITVADQFDALTSARVYRKHHKAYTDREAIQVLYALARKGKLDPKVVAALERAYNRCRILLARAFYYTEIRNPLAALAGNELRPMLSIAKETLLKAYNIAQQGARGQDRSVDWQQLQLKILVRLATVANFRGEPLEALRYIKKARALVSLKYRRYRDHIAVQEAYAMRELGHRREALRITEHLTHTAQERWVKLTSHTLMAKLLVESGEVAKAQVHIATGERELRTFRADCMRHQSRHSFGFSQRWWNFDRIGWFAGNLAMASTRILRMRNDPATPKQAAITIRLFESAGYAVQASNARLELARYYVNSGQIEKGIFYLERELQVANCVGNRLGIVTRTLLLAEAYSRLAACTTGSHSVEFEGRAINELEKALRRRKLPEDLKTKLKAELAIVYWRADKNASALALARKVYGSSKSQQNTNEASLKCRFIVACETGLGAKELLQIARIADEHNYPVLAAEILAECIRRYPAHSADPKRYLRRILKTMADKCWIRHTRTYPLATK